MSHKWVNSHGYCRVQLGCSVFLSGSAFARFRRQCGHTWGRQTQVGLLQTGGLNKLEPMIDIKRCRHMHV